MKNYRAASNTAISKELLGKKFQKFMALK